MSGIPRDNYGLRCLPLYRRRKWVLTKSSTETDDAYKERHIRCEEWNRAFDQLREKTEELRNALDLNCFIISCLDRMTQLLLGDSIVAVASTDSMGPPYPLEEELDELALFKCETLMIERWLVHITLQNEALLQSLHRVIQYLLQSRLGPNQALSWMETPGGANNALFRYHSISSASPYDENLGIRCPGWRKNGSSDVKISEEHVKQHFRKGDRSSPPFISATESPGRLLNIIKNDKKGTLSTSTVFVLSPSKLSQLGVELYRSTDLVNEFGLPIHSSKHLDGIHYATPTHWLIHRWAPREYFECELSVNDFRNLCADQGIVERKQHPHPEHSSPTR
jgi:hypothetical protein